MKLTYMRPAFLGSLTALAHNANDDTSTIFLQGREARTLDDSKLLSRNLQTCNLGEGTVYCDSSRSCVGFEIEGCTVYCLDDSCAEATIKNSSVFCQDYESCKSATIVDSNVECSTGSACAYTQIRRSTVYCAAVTSCASTGFTASVVSCGELNACYLVEFKDQCSCSDGSADLSECKINGAPSEEFCSSKSAGITCAALGNPICSGMAGYTNPTTSDPEDSTPTSTSSETTQEPTTIIDTTKPPIVDIMVRIVVPIVVALIGLAVAVFNRKRIVHHYQHYRAGANAGNNSLKA